MVSPFRQSIVLNPQFLDEADYYRPSFNTDITGPIYGSDLDPNEYYRNSTVS